jgi:hypothetical protein
LVVACSLAALGCTSKTTAAPLVSTAAQPEVADAAHGGDNPHFYFLPPLVPQPIFAGTFDPNRFPSVRICEWAASGCVPGGFGVTFTTTTGPGSETVRVDPGEENYLVNWHTGDFPLDPSKGYRIFVLEGSEELGHADVAIASSGAAVKNLKTGETIWLQDGRTLPIKFRIETAAGLANGEPCVLPEECASRFCVEGLCCDGLCDGACESCSAASQVPGGEDGVCGFRAAGAACADDGNACTADACSGTSVACEHTPLPGCCNADADCNDDNACTTDTCSGPGGTCSYPPVPGCCNTDADCNDDDPCTVDTCNGGTCSHAAATVALWDCARWDEAVWGP